jgi:pyrimidine dimer DNA glycosylase
MQTFLCEPNFAETAKCLDYRRLGKQRVEAKQILEINLILKNPENFTIDGAGYILQKGLQSGQSMYYKPLIEWRNDGGKLKWENHPAVLMWRGYEFALALYGWITCEEWISRGYRDNLLSFFGNTLKDIFVNWNLPNPHIDINYYPKWYKDSLEIYKVIQSHRSNLLRKDYNFYSKFNWNDVDSNLPYYWPTKKEN